MDTGRGGFGRSGFTIRSERYGFLLEFKLQWGGTISRRKHDPTRWSFTTNWSLRLSSSQSLGFANSIVPHLKFRKYEVMDWLASR